MSRPDKLVEMHCLAAVRRAARFMRALALPLLCFGCAGQLAETRGPAQATLPTTTAQLHNSAPSAPNFGRLATSQPIQPVAYLRTQAEEPKDNAPESQPKLKISLPMAIEMCVNNNFRILAEAQNVSIAEADLKTSALIPNPTLTADYLLIPLQYTDINNQLGPPQWDISVSFPIDWLLFGKRLAAIRAARLGVEVKNAEFSNVLRTQLSRTVDAFYELLEDEAYFQLAEQNLKELMELEKLTNELATAKLAGAIELERIKLAVHEAVLDRHDRELALDIAKAKLRPFIGRTAADPDYEVIGELTVNAVVPPPTLEEAVALAEAHRPDLLSGRIAIDQAHASVELERRKAKPALAIEPGWTYQNQQYINGFPNGSLFDIGISTSLPFTDRNQGNIRKARATVALRQFNYLANRADALAEVEASVASYSDAVEHLSLFNTKETLNAAHDLRSNTIAAYRAGNRKLIEMLDAQKAYQSRLGHIIEFESTYWRALNSLNAAVGLKAYDPE
ncbi:MAG TPA: TolC family protein [Gemmataceae bacterium]|jgi:cobalt-zinc-cadmium efflux system outer membrane protein|nr:TolC family protein [Gemmataceae bacterium]